MAERVGFEPTVPLRVHLISSQARSTGLRHLSDRSEAIAAVRARASRETRHRGAARPWRGYPAARSVSNHIRGDCLAREDLMQATGTVEKILGGGRYQILLETGQTVTAQLSGRMRRFRIRVIPGDRVQVGVSPYDPTHGFVTFRLREGQNAPR
jgi:translation initiation factor IF-1